MNAGSGEAELDQQTRGKRPTHALLVHTGGYRVSRGTRVGGTDGAAMERQWPYDGVCRQPGHKVEGKLVKTGCSTRSCHMELADSVTQSYVIIIYAEPFDHDPIPQTHVNEAEDLEDALDIERVRGNDASDSGVAIPIRTSSMCVILYPGFDSSDSRATHRADVKGAMLASVVVT